MRGDDPSISNVTTRLIVDTEFPACAGMIRSIRHDSGCVAATEFPACAGMIRMHDSHMFSGYGVPRMRGDDPKYSRGMLTRLKSSPHARG